MAVNESDRMAGFLERLFKDHVVRGTAEIIGITDPKPKGRWQKCKIDVVVSAPDFETTTMTLDYVIHRDKWPEVGKTYPADVHVEQLERTEILFPTN